MNAQAALDIDVIKAIIGKSKTMPGAMLVILHEIQDAAGCIPPDAVPLIANGLNLSRAEVHGVITYYHHFRQQPAAKHVLKLCRAEACQAVGAAALAAHAKATLGCDFHENSADGVFTLEPVFCLGMCACGPSLMVNDAVVHARMSSGKFDALLQELRGMT
ncbi:MAG TPA: formate dehydrogenase subunit gamma [Gallionellaceae bacterium]|nr:formate dehydrogenase subunit gamma [Gallionellaceae bacterium]